MFPVLRRKEEGKEETGSEAKAEMKALCGQWISCRNRFVLVADKMINPQCGQDVFFPDGVWEGTGESDSRNDRKMVGLGLWKEIISEQYVSEKLLVHRKVCR